jgi:hypothetical protein
MRTVLGSAPTVDKPQRRSLAMATTGPREVQLKEAERLADLSGALYDLESALGFCRLLARLEVKAPDDFVSADALTTAILVRYARCFTTGVRAKLSTDVVDSLSERKRAVHDFVLLVRDKYVAHSVNSLEENVVTVHVVEPPDDRRVGTVGYLGGRFVSLSKEIATEIAELCETLMKYVDQQIKDERARLQKLIEALPLDDVYRFPELRVFVPDWDDLDRNRKKR